ncbi:MAG: BLUF domain-containing protein [Gammaproteobacteria bacterium]
MLVRLLYASRATDPITAEITGTILEQSRRNNELAGISGILCSSAAAGVFLQALEGGRKPVNALYARIVADPRHKDVTLLDYEEITERHFSGWRMGGVDLSRVNLGSVLRYGESNVLNPFTMSRQSALAFLEELAESAAVVSRNTT